MLSRKSIKYRIYPTKFQERLLNNNLEGCRLLYNAMLEQRKIGWENDKISFSCYDQQKYFRHWIDKTKYNVHSQVQQNVAVRIDLAFKAFFRRIKNGEKPGYPRFKSKDRYDSFTYPQTGWKVLENQINLTKIGKVKSVIHKKSKSTLHLSLSKVSEIAAMFRTRAIAFGTRHLCKRFTQILSLSELFSVRFDHLQCLVFASLDRFLQISYTGDRKGTVFQEEGRRESRCLTRRCDALTCFWSAGRGRYSVGFSHRDSFVAGL
jgi:hypothetical protein